MVNEYKETVSPEHRTCEYPVVVTACTRLGQLQARPNLSMEVGSGLELSPLAEVLVIGSYYRERVDLL